MFEKLFTKEEVKKPDVMVIDDELASQEYYIRKGKEVIGELKLVSDEWVFKHYSYPIMVQVITLTQDEIFDIYARLEQLNS